jgi:hypothetical protein
MRETKPCYETFLCFDSVKRTAKRQAKKLTAIFMRKKHWFKPKAFTHITSKLSQKDGGWIKSYITDPQKIQKHKFFPLIHKTIATKRYKDSIDKQGNKVKRHYTYKKGKRIPNIKYREIYYPNHLDSHIYAYYAQKILEPKYEAELLKEPGLNESILAYRRIPVIGEERCKCNIDFANESFDLIKQFKGETAVLALDISKFFDSLDHKRLKQSWVSLLGRKDLELHDYNVYKSLVNFSYVEMNEMLHEFGYNHPKQLIQEDVACFVDNGQEFRDRIKNKGYIKKNPFRRNEEDGSKKTVGIPQGTPISPLLANLYLIEFDRKVINLLTFCKGFYRRYSDDILVICPKNMHTSILEQVYELIKEFKLVIQPEKTQRSFFVDGRLAKGEKPVVYLGFQFDGNRKLLKAASVSKLYRKMKTSVKYRAYRAFVAKKKNIRGAAFDETLHRKKLYRQFSFLGAKKGNRKKRNFFSYAYFASRIMNEPAIEKQLSGAWKILHKEIKKQEKKYKLKKIA